MKYNILNRKHLIFLLCMDVVLLVQATPPCDTASIAYPASSICQNAGSLSPQILGTTGGVFSGSAGLSIQSQTGTIDPSQSIAGQHFITYMTTGTCPDTTLVFLNIISAPDASFLYPAPICENDSANPSPVLADPGGYFTAFGNVLFADSSTGEIDLANSQSGNWLIYRMIGGACGDTATQIVQIHQQSDASFHYPDTLYCQGQQIAAPVILGQGGGTFWTNAPGIALDSSTGFIDLPNSALSWPYIHYTSPGPCPDTGTFWMVIAPQGDASFSYVPTSYCQSNPNPLPIVTGDTNGYFSCLYGNAVVDSLTGEIDLTASQPGDSILIRHFVPGPSAWCPDEQVVRIRIYAPDTNISVNYSQNTYCVTDPDPTPTVNGTPGGTFQAVPQGLAMSALNGKVDLSASVQGTYSIRYYPPGACSDTSASFLMTILPPPALNLHYPVASVCQGAGSIVPLNLSDTLGQFSLTTGTGLILDPLTGAINADSSAPGNYEIKYQSGGVCPLDTGFSFAIYPVPDPTLFSDADSNRICHGESINLLTVGGDKFEFYYQDSLVRALSANPSFAPPFPIQDQDQFKIRAINLEGECEDWDSLQMNVILPPEITDLDYPATVQSGASFNIQVQLDRSGIELSYELLDHSALDTSQLKAGMDWITDSTYAIPQTLQLNQDQTVGKAAFKLRPKAGACWGSPDSLFLTILPDKSPLFIPGLITPNGDGRNDVWEIRYGEGVSPDEYAIQVFNKSGGRVYRQQGLSAHWNGQGLPDGVYWYVVEEGNGETVSRGGITIRRK